MRTLGALLSDGRSVDVVAPSLRNINMLALHRHGALFEPCLIWPCEAKTKLIAPQMLMSVSGHAGAVRKKMQGFEGHGCARLPGRQPEGLLRSR